MEQNIEEKNELSDILLEQKSSNKTAKIKRLIVIAVLLALLFVLVLMIMKLISKPDDTSSILTDSILQNTPPQNIIEDYNITTYNGIENINDTIDNNSTVAQNIVVLDNYYDSTISPNTVNTTTTNTPKKNTTKSKTNDTVSATVTSENTLKSGHYIQVGAFANKPNKNLLDSIVQDGYQYHLYTIKSKQLTSVLIGPFSSEAIARMELAKIKDSISKSAFYKRMQ